MVFKKSYDYLVALVKILLHISLRHKIYSLGGTSDEYDVVFVGGSDEIGDSLPCALVCVCGASGKGVSASVNVGIFVSVILRKSVNDLLRTLCGCAVIKPHKIVTVYLFAQNWKIPAYLL